MEVLLNKIKELIRKKEINFGQAMYMIYLFNEESFFISPTNLLKLVNDGYVKGNKVTRKVLEVTISMEGKEVSGTVTPKYEEKLSNDVVKRLCATFCVYDKNKKITFPGDLYDTVEKTANAFLPNEKILAYYFMLFLYMFPVEGQNNRKWEKFFTGSLYTGPTLRIRSKSLGKKFIKEAKRRDMGVMLYATLLYVQEATKDGKVFIKKPINFLGDEFDEWCAIALVKLRKARDVRELFRKGGSGSGSIYTMI